MEPNTTSEFVAYSRMLLRVLSRIEDSLNQGDVDLAKRLVAELKEDTQKDIEA